MSNREWLLDEILISPSTSIKDALVRIDHGGIGAAVICDDQRRLMALLTDGDVRRALLSARSLEDSCDTIAHPNPITITAPIDPKNALLLMHKHDINHLPVIDAAGLLLDLLRRNELVTEDDTAVRALDRLALTTVSPDLSISETISRLDLAGTGALLLCDEDGHLHGLLTDGDVRRAVLQGVAMTSPCREIASREPVTVPQATTAANALHVMNENDINHVPVLGADGRVVDFILRKDLVGEESMGLSAVIMAGGFGKRLQPLTDTTPKPMLPIGNRPLLERTIEQLKNAGITNVHLTTHHLSDQFVDHFSDGEEFGISLKYAREDQPLGTAGGLKLVEHSADPVLVLNGDILTNVSFRDMLLFHRERRAELTVGVRKYEIEVPFGVVECDDFRIRNIREKPTEVLFINAGIYLMEPSAIASIPDGVPFDMTDLIELLIAEERAVVSFPILEYWLDIGRREDFAKAEDDLRNGRI